MVDPARDKPTVIALRELAQGEIGLEIINMGSVWIYTMQSAKKNYFNLLFSQVQIYYLNL